MVLDSQVQNPLGLQVQHALTVCAVCRSLLFFSGLHVVETLEWLIWPLPELHCCNSKSVPWVIVSSEGSCSLHPTVSPMTVGR